MLTIYTQPAPGYSRLPLVPDGPMETDLIRYISGNTNITDTNLMCVKIPEILELVSRVNSC